MKKVTYIILIILSVFATACTNWLDVQPKEEIEADKMFEDERGYLQCLNGSYLILSNAGLYGLELTVGFPDEIVHYWLERSEFYNANYKDVAVVGRLDAVWSQMYQSIANLNLMLGYLEEDAVEEFKYYNFIKGEALALRAYMHLELLNLFGPVFTGTSEELSIPYRESFSNQLVQKMPVSEVLVKIERDLLEAYDLLKEDPINIYGREVSASSGERPDNKDLAYDFRGCRMNYYAVCATLARLYILEKDYVNALKYASEVINAENIFQLVQRKDILDEQLRDKLFKRELVWALIDSQSTDYGHILEKEGYEFDYEFWEYLYNSAEKYGSAEDYRYQYWYRKTSGSTLPKYLLVKYSQSETDSETEDVDKANYIPMIRLTEMYYIAAESLLDTDPKEAYRLLNVVRESRNLPALPVDIENDKVALMDRIVDEARKDFFGEGKMFAMYKRLFRDIDFRNGKEIKASEGLFELPLPNDELEFGSNEM